MLPGQVNAVHSIILEEHSPALGPLHQLEKAGLQDGELGDVPRYASTWIELKLKRRGIYRLQEPHADRCDQIWLQIDNPSTLLPTTQFERAKLLRRCTLRTSSGMHLQTFSGLDLYLHGEFHWQNPNLLRLPICQVPLRAWEHDGFELQIETRDYIPEPASAFMPPLRLWLPEDIAFLVAKFRANLTAPCKSTPLGYFTFFDSKLHLKQQERSRNLFQQIESCWVQKVDNDPLSVLLPFGLRCYRISVMFLEGLGDQLYTGPIPFQSMFLLVDDAVRINLGTPNSWMGLNESVNPANPPNPGTYHHTFEAVPSLTSMQEGSPKENSTLNLSRSECIRLQITWQKAIPKLLRVYVSALVGNVAVTRDGIGVVRFVSRGV